MFKLWFLRKSLLRIFEKNYENRLCFSENFQLLRLNHTKFQISTNIICEMVAEGLKISKIILPIYCGAEHLIFFDLSSTQRKVVPWGPRMVGQLSAVHNSEMTPKWWSTLWNSAKAWVAIHSYSYWLIFNSRKIES